MSRVFYLEPIDNRKSFYNKARVMERDNGDKELLSYNTIVCKIDINGEFKRLWSGESATTMRHINSFCAFYGINGGGVKWWREQAIQA